MAIPNYYIDKFTDVDTGERRDICPAADKVRVDNDNFDGTDLDEVLDEIADAIDDAGSGGYAPPAGGIPKTDLSSDVQTSLGKADTAYQKPASGIPATDLADGVIPDTANLATKTEVNTGLAGKVDKVTGYGLSKNDYTDADKAAVGTIGSKANAADVYTKAQTDAAISAASSGAVSVIQPDPADGTFIIRVGETDYTINLNHTHPNMVKLEIVDEEPSNPAMDTIYAQVNDADTPTEIQSLWIAGLEFVGGGGDDGLPKMRKPKDNTIIDLGMNLGGDGVSKTIDVLAKNLGYGGSTAGLTVEVSGGSDLSLSYGLLKGQSSVTIAQQDALDGVQLTIVFSNSGGLRDGELTFKQGNDVLAVVDVVIDPYAGFIYDKAIGGADNTNTSIADATGYCISPAIPLVNGHTYKVRFGFNGNTKIVPISGIVYGASTVGQDSLGDSVLNFTYENKTNYRMINLNNASVVQAVATFKTSELDTCYLYDVTAAKYLFRGWNANQSSDSNS